MLGKDLIHLAIDSPHLEQAILSAVSAAHSRDLPLRKHNRYAVSAHFVLRSKLPKN